MTFRHNVAGVIGTTAESEELTALLSRIKHLSDQLVFTQADSQEARRLAARIADDIAQARSNLRTITTGKP